MNLLALMLAVPCVCLLATLSSRVRKVTPSLLALAPLPGLAAASQWIDRPSFEWGAFRFALDGSGAMLLGSAAVLWIAAGAFVASSLRGKANIGRFCVCWLLSLTGSLGVFVAADLMSFLTMFALASLPAYGLVIQEGTPSSWKAGKVYMGFALLGEACLIMAFVLLAASAPNERLMISDAVAALPLSPWRDGTLALLVLGFGIKMGLVPVHFWLPLAHPAAPAAGSAVLSGAIINCGVVGLIRFLPLQDALPDWGLTLAILGMVTAIYGVLIGITQVNPKTILAYSSVSQMGVIAAMLGMGLSAGDVSVGGDAAFYAMHHVFAKGALFLGVGVVAATGRCQRWLVFVPSALLALGLAGLPFTGGALAKIAAKNVMGSGFAGTFATVSSVGTALLMFVFLKALLRSTENTSKHATPRGLVIPFLGLAVTGFVVRWFVYLVAGYGGVGETFSGAVLWGSLWPVLVGGGLALALWSWSGRLPMIPAGDLGEMCLGGLLRGLGRGKLALWMDSVLRQWEVAASVLVLIAILLAVMIAI